jgi:16S rRNA (adenine1518-N6/adenine1519-N6)-dimethyltransferase
MDLLQKTIDLCKKYEIKPARSKGQNFLIEENVYDKIIAAADLKPDDIVLEVGPGLGFLTTKLAERVKKVIAVELDDKLAGLLLKKLAVEGLENVEVLNDNILDFKFSSGMLTPLTPLVKGDYKIVANLPYNITSIFLRKFLEAENKPESMILMLQKEVAERIAAVPPKMSLLAVSVQYYAKPEIISLVTKNNFWPVPEVDSAIIKISAQGRSVLGGKCLSPLAPLTKGGKNIVDVDKDREFFRIVKIGFSARRKMLKNNLSAGLHIEQNLIENKLKLAGFSSKVRAQELSVDDWFRLVEVLREFVV